MRRAAQNPAPRWRPPRAPVAEWHRGQDNGHAPGTLASALDPSNTPSPDPLVSLVPDPRTRALAVLLCQGEDPTELAHHLLKRPRRDPRAHLAALSLLDRVARTLLPHPLPPRSSTSRIVRAYVSHRKDRWALLLRLSACLTVTEIASALGLHRVTTYRSIARAMIACAKHAERLKSQRASREKAARESRGPSEDLPGQ